MGFHTKEIIAMGQSESLVLLNKVRQPAHISVFCDIPDDVNLIS